MFLGQSCRDACDHGSEMGLHIGCTDAEDPVAAGFEEGLAGPVMLLLRFVDGAIHFDNEAMFGAEEVHDKGADGVLPPDLRPVESPHTQSLP